MDDREEVELTWRKEFDELGEDGVRHEFFKGTFRANQRKEGFACRWLDETRRVQEKKNSRQGRNIRIALGFLVIFVIATTVIFNWFPSLIAISFLEVVVESLSGVK